MRVVYHLHHPCIEEPPVCMGLFFCGLLAARPSGRLLRRKLSSAVPPLATPSTTGPSSSHWEVIETVCTSDSRFAFDDVLVTSANMYTCNAAVPSCVARRTKET